MSYATTSMTRNHMNEFSGRNRYELPKVKLRVAINRNSQYISMRLPLQWITTDLRMHHRPSHHELTNNLITLSILCGC